MYPSSVTLPTGVSSEVNITIGVGPLIYVSTDTIICTFIDDSGELILGSSSLTIDEATGHSKFLTIQVPNVAPAGRYTIRTIITGPGAAIYNVSVPSFSLILISKRVTVPTYPSVFIAGGRYGPLVFELPVAPVNDLTISISTS
jgi:hypothetical protein